MPGGTRTSITQKQVSGEPQTPHLHMCKHQRAPVDLRRRPPLLPLRGSAGENHEARLNLSGPNEASDQASCCYSHSPVLRFQFPRRPDWSGSTLRLSSPGNHRFPEGADAKGEKPLRESSKTSPFYSYARLVVGTAKWVWELRSKRGRNGLSAKTRLYRHRPC